MNKKNKIETIIIKNKSQNKMKYLCAGMGEGSVREEAEEEWYGQTGGN